MIPLSCLYGKYEAISSLAGSSRLVRLSHQRDWNRGKQLAWCSVRVSLALADAAVSQLTIFTWRPYCSSVMLSVRMRLTNANDSYAYQLAKTHRISNIIISNVIISTLLMPPVLMTKQLK